MKLNESNKLGTLLIAAAAFSFTVSACNTKGPDSKSSADSANNAKANSTDSATRKMADRTDSTSSSVRKGFKDDAHFVTDAADGGAFEIAAAHLALKNSADKRVREFASMMIKDHTKWGNALKAYAKSKNITVPDQLSNDKKELVTKLAEKGSDKFDVKYMDKMRRDHKDDLDAFVDAQKNTKDSELKKVLDNTIPGIQHHLMMATTLDSIIDKEK